MKQTANAPNCAPRAIVPRIRNAGIHSTTITGSANIAQHYATLSGTKRVSLAAALLLMAACAQQPECEQVPINTVLKEVNQQLDANPGDADLIERKRALERRQIHGERFVNC